MRGDERVACSFPSLFRVKCPDLIKRSSPGGINLILTGPRRALTTLIVARFPPAMARHRPGAADEPRRHAKPLPMTCLGMPGPLWAPVGRVHFVRCTTRNEPGLGRRRGHGHAEIRNIGLLGHHVGHERTTKIVPLAAYARGDVAVHHAT